MKYWSIARRQRRVMPKQAAAKAQIQAKAGLPQEQPGEASDDTAAPVLEHDFSQVQIASSKLGSALSLSSSVGKNGQNLPDDVVQVQTRLSRLGFESGEVTGQYNGKITDAILTFQQFFLDKPDGTIDLNSPSHVRLNQLPSAAAAQTPKPKAEEKTPDAAETANLETTAPQFRVKRGREFNQSIDGKAIDSKLMQTLNDFFKYLIAHNHVGGDVVLLEGLRDPKKAHRWSTAYAIRNDRIPLDALKKLPQGRDVDGNQWYRDGETMEQAKRRAVNLGLSSPSTPASEGYVHGEAKQLPNDWNQGISNHMIGKAVKVAIPWATEKGGQLNDPIANDLIKKFGLKRPLPKDTTHFELLQGSPPGEEEYGHRDSES